MKKIRTCAALLLAVLLIPMLTGCIQGSAEETTKPPAARAIQTETQQTQPVQTDPAAPAPAGTLTKEEAEAIALEYAGLTADQVTRLWTEYEIDDRIPQYDIEFHAGDWEYEFEIHAETGAILSYDKDAERS